MKKFKRATKALFAFAFVATLFSKGSALSSIPSTTSKSTPISECIFDDGNSRDGIYILSINPIAFN